MESLLRKWDGEEVILRFDQPTGAWIIIAIHNTHRGVATGGTRMKQYPHVKAAMQDALKLAEGMTFKFATAYLKGIPSASFNASRMKQYPHVKTAMQDALKLA